jgi:hypothetical protein
VRAAIEVQGLGGTAARRDAAWRVVACREFKLAPLEIVFLQFFE